MASDRKLAQKLHPGKNSEAPTPEKTETWFKGIRNAYAALSDPGRRSEHCNTSVASIESNARNRQNCNSILFQAAMKGDTQGVVKAVRLGARVQWRNPSCDGCTALHVAAREGRESTVKQLVSMGADIKSANLFRETPLHESAGCGQEKVVIQLCGYGADPNCLNKYDATPLHCAAAEGHILAALALVCCGADTLKINVQAISPAELAAQRGHARLAECLAHATTPLRPALATPPKTPQSLQYSLACECLLCKQLLAELKLALRGDSSEDLPSLPQGRGAPMLTVEPGAAYPHNGRLLTDTPGSPTRTAYLPSPLAEGSEGTWGREVRGLGDVAGGSTGLSFGPFSHIVERGRVSITQLGADLSNKGLELGSELGHKGSMSLSQLSSNSSALLQSCKQRFGTALGDGIGQNEGGGINSPPPDVFESWDDVFEAGT